MGECIFCQIAADELPSHRVYEAEDVIAFLDVNPLANGHTLVVPREHHERLQECPETTAIALWSAVTELVPAIEAAVDADATNIGINNGSAAGQEISHSHVHIVPRFEGDGGRPIHAVAGRRPDLDDDDLEAIGEAINQHLK